ncbi:MAG: phosphatase PAP2 family protein [Ferruginibacter sp.]
MTTEKGLIQRLLGKISLSIVVLIILFIVCLAGLYVLVDMVFEDNNYSFDYAVFNAIEPYYNSTNTAIMEFITFFGSHKFLLPANLLLIGLAFFLGKTHWAAIKIASIAISSTIVLFSLKEILKRERPPVPLLAKAHGYSFPSGHTFTSLSFFGMLIYIVYKNVKSPWLKWSLIVFMSLLTLSVGFSRIYLKLHYASDVVAGICLGVIWLLLAKWILYKAEKSKKLAEPVKSTQ